MCGFLVDTTNKNSKEQFLASLDSIKHRGPDHPRGYQRVGTTHLGHNRLKIVNLNSESNQPFISKSRKHTIVFNGEIYSYEAIAKRFSIELRSKSDTELIIELYERMGSKVLDHLDGMFAFIILNNEDGSFFAARDRLGVKPLYYRKNSSGYIFASEIIPILQLSSSSKLDDISIQQYRKLRGVFGNRTFYSGIQTLPPGHFIKDGKIEPYWDLPVTPWIDTVSSEEILFDLSKSISIRETSAVPIGCFLSGGLDSSLISVLSKRSDSFWSVGSKTQNEFEYAEQVANIIGKPLEKVLVSNEEFIRVAKEMIQARKEPLLVPNEVYIYKLCKTAKEKATVLLSGEGADELFSGYYRIFNWAKSISGKPGNWSQFTLEAFDEHYSYTKGGDLELLAEVVNPYIQSSETPYEMVKKFFIKEHLQGLLRRLDYASMLASVETRCPFLDYRLFEKYWRLSPNLVLSQQEGKECLKKAAEHVLPTNIIRRPKVGFPIDLKRVFNNEREEKSSYDLWFDFNLKHLEEVR